jgi:hypothetical protein
MLPEPEPAWRATRLDWIAIVLVVLAPVGPYVGYRYARAAIRKPYIDFLTVSAFREVCSGIAGVLIGLLGVNVLVGRPLPTGIGLLLLVIAVVIDRIPAIAKLALLRRYDGQDKRGELDRRRD